MEPSQLREEVQSKAESAIADRLKTDSSTETPDLSESEILNQDWDTSDYNSFFGDCRSDGYSAKQCGEFWSKLTSDSDDTQQAVTNVSPQETTDVLLLKEGSEACDLAAQYLGEPLVNEDIEAVHYDSDRGQELLESVDTVPKLPAYIQVTGDSVESKQLDTLFEEYLL